MTATERPGTAPLVITGMGAVTVFGDGCEALFAALRAGRSGLHTLRGMTVARGKDRSAQIEDPARSGPWRVSDMACDSVAEALAQAGLDPARMTGRTGLYVGTTGGDSRVLEDRYADFLSVRQALASGAEPEIDDELAEALVRFPIGVLADVVAARIGLSGPRYVATNACASGSIAMAMAMTALRRGVIDRAVVVGADQLKPSSYWGAERSGFIGHDLRPFHAERDGSVLGDGAGAIVLEPAATAAARGATALAQLAGWGITCDDNPQPIIPPEDGASNAAAIRLALADGALDPSEIDYFNAHGTGTPLIDRLETASAKASLGEQARRISMSSTKSITGHLAAASPVVETIATVFCLREQWVHPTARLDKVDPALDLDYVPLKGKPKPLRAAISNSLGGGGTNTVVVLRALGTGASAAPRPSGGEPAAEADVVVTGLGAVSRLGDGAESLSSAYVAEDVSPRTAEFSVLDHIGEEAGYQYISRTAQVGFGAAAMAMADAGLPRPLPLEGPFAANRVAVVMGTAVGGLSTAAEVLCPHLLADPTRITPTMALDHGPQLAATLTARAAESTGPMITLTSGLTAGLQAIEIGRALLAAGACDIAIVGAAEAIDEPIRHAARLLGRRRGHADPAAFAATFADGAGCLVLERADDARRRGAPVKASLAACASWAEAAAPGEPGGSGPALEQCLRTVLPSGEDQPHLGYHVGGAAPDVPTHKVVSSGFRPGRLGRSLAATPVLAVVAAVRQLAADPAGPALVTAAAPGGAAAALRLEAVR
ncbi:hypothetical protein SD37_16840 [Amycolatopsis orientalis]|uniref:Ketosynthase family 3 (KS3) domain-containing protein n=1 Tax=Amycolatopsis orientalis TaxID=31958 RepID=A0A193BY99_AMYOR|nr:beta-ketoacyl-[acyl-carrier-protein] synthase family protein [Amycolatopsis orientalis]ANN17144.1 hypothetical protein SD37_16840 [Amycolatopsis orientalis]